MKVIVDLKLYPSGLELVAAYVAACQTVLAEAGLVHRIMPMAPILRGIGTLLRPSRDATKSFTKWEHHELQPR